MKMNENNGLAFLYMWIKICALVAIGMLIYADIKDTNRIDALEELTVQIQKNQHELIEVFDNKCDVCGVKEEGGESPFRSSFSTDILTKDKMKVLKIANDTDDCYLELCPKCGDSLREWLLTRVNQ
jgi:hypothetical protein